MCHTRKTQAVTNHVGLKPNGEGHEGQQLQKKDSCSITGSGVQKKKKACVLLCYEMSQQLDSCANITVCISCMPCFILYTVPGMS